MGLEEDNGSPLRDIVIETRVDVRHIREALDKISECIKDHDERLRQIEISGSAISQDTQKNVVKLQVRVSNLETDSESHKQTESAQNHWVDSIWAKLGIASGIVLGIAAFLRDVLFP